MEQSIIKREPIGDGIKICVSEAHTFGTDAILLANFAAPRKTDTACDLGTGCGIIPLLWCRGNAPKKAFGVDIQPEAISLAEKSIEENNLYEKFSAVLSDILELKGKLPFGSFQLVTCNPPYKALGAGIKSKTGSDKIARHETACTLEDIISTASRLLQTSGRLCMCNRPERLADMIALMRKYKIEPKRMRLVCKRVGCEPWLVLLEGRRCGNSGMRVDPTLYVEDGENFSKEMLEIYGSYKDGAK
ncbi:MAG: methyltransferase domain-containing protein [Clostridia bacterium]|nr:methyltransferase domain-containing protein [Clostridia bacterium]